VKDEREREPPFWNKSSLTCALLIDKSLKTFKSNNDFVSVGDIHMQQGWNTDQSIWFCYLMCLAQSLHVHASYYFDILFYRLYLIKLYAFLVPPCNSWFLIQMAGFSLTRKRNLKINWWKSFLLILQTKKLIDGKTPLFINHLRV